MVGVDGSSPSLAALEWAAEQAVLKQVELHVVVGWHLPLMLGMPLPLPNDFDPLEPANDVIEQVKQATADINPGLVVRATSRRGRRPGTCCVRPPTSGPASWWWGRAGMAR